MANLLAFDVPDLTTMGHNNNSSSIRIRVGASTSGKSLDFDSSIRRFESYRPSHSFLLCLRVWHLHSYRGLA